MKQTLFWPVKVDDNVIALRCQGNNNFCMRHAFTEWNVLLADGLTISQETRLQVEELVVSREIYDVKFRLQDARVYDENIILATTGTTHDSPSSVTHKVTLKHTEERFRSTTWGETTTVSNELTNEYDALVSPYSVMTVDLLATQGTCNVPFSYTQRDLRFDGTPLITDKDDGLFVGVNSYNYTYRTKEVPIPDRPPPPSSSD